MEKQKKDRNPGPELRGSVLPAAARDAALEGEMFGLMDRYFLADRTCFEQDLARKDWHILLRDPAGILRGFTSLAHRRTELDGRTVEFLYSGDTIIQREFWGSLELPRVWGRFMLDRIAAAGEVPLYWFLLSSGYKTYRFLPVFFREFFPRHDRETPAEPAKLLAHFCRLLFSDGFDPVTGTVVMASPTPLREGIAEITPERLADPHISFFVRHNPDHAKGVELACIAPLTVDNLRPFIRRALGV